MELILLGKVSEPILKKLSLIEGYDMKLTYFFTGHSEFNFQLNHKFNFLISYEEKVKVETRIGFITQAYFIPLNFIEKGWRVIIGLEINPNNKLINSLSIIDYWDDNWNNTITLKT